MKPLFNRLSSWKRPDEDEEFVDKAVDSLFKKLKTKKGAIEDLEAVLNNPNSNHTSKCVTIPRSLDGRLQVSHRKGLPHVIYCRVFRWPDLQTHHELKSVETCQYSFSSKKSEICINPFHYERIDVPVLPPVLVPKHVEYSPGHSVIYNNNNTQQNNKFNPPSQINYSSIKSQYFLSELDHSKSPSTHNYYNSTNTPLNSNNLSYSFNSYGSNSPQNTLLEESELSSSNYSPKSTNYIPNNLTPIKQENSNWCSIVYYELNTRIGEVFYANHNEIFIDGFTDPSNYSGRRLCLGIFSNVNRSATTENCRKHIGKGIHLYNDNGDIYVECLSDCPIFIQSRNCNLDKGFHPNTVCKLLSGYSLRVFQSKLFAELLNEAINHGYDSVYDLSNMCIIKLSFVKGWGADYYRQEVSSCPCWIEIRLNGPFKWLDQVLKEMGSSLNPVTSVS